jgi:SAM-dependent methyltransferase
MYFVELGRALGECRRVLKPGGRVTFMAWSAPNQPFIELLLGPLFQHIAPPEPEPGAPDPFCFAEPGSLSAALGAAGFRELEEETATVPTPFPGTPRQYWDWFWEMIPPLQPLLAQLPADRLDQVIAESVAALSAYDDGTHVTLPIRVVVASGHR